MSETIYIRDMVCVRCRMAVQSVLEAADVAYSAVELGWAKLNNTLTAEQRQSVAAGLQHYELSLIENKTQVLIERIKNEIARRLQEAEPMPMKLSAHLSKVLGYNYTYLANTFSEEEGITLERYFIGQRIEKAKELMVYEDASLKDITYQLNYSSVSHFCLQFKKVSGLTPADFRKLSRTENFIWRPL